MKETHGRLKSFDLHLVEGTDSAVLSFELVPVRPAPGRAATSQMVRIELPIAHLAMLQDRIASATSYRGRIVPPSDVSH